MYWLKAWTLVSDYVSSGPAMLFTSCVTLAKSLNLSVLQFPLLLNEIIIVSPVIRVK